MTYAQIADGARRGDQICQMLIVAIERLSITDPTMLVLENLRRDAHSAFSSFQRKE